MADRLIQELICNAGGYYSEFNTGDVIRTYYREETDILFCTLNGTEHTYTHWDVITNKALKSGWWSGALGTFSSVMFCDGIYLNRFKFRNDPPYIAVAKEESTICKSQLISDITIKEVTTTRATSATSSDGSFTVSATSSYGGLKYSLEGYTTGVNYQASGTFTGLAPGAYTVYAVDAAGFYTARTVTISTTLVLGVVQYWTFQNLEGVRYKIELCQRDYTGVSTERDLLGSTPAVLNHGESNTTREAAIYPSEMIINAISETEKEYLIMMANADEREYVTRLYYMDESGYHLHWQGYLISSLFSEPYYEKPSNYVSTLNATDGLADLSKEDFSDESGVKMEGLYSLFEVIRVCLQKTKIEQGFRVAMNVFEASHSQADTDDPLHQTFVDVASYYTESDPDDCYTVLNKVLTSLGCEIRSHGGYWYIIYLPECMETYAYREYDADGNYITHGSLSPIVDFKEPLDADRNVWLAGGKTMQLEAIYKKININCVRALRENLFPEFEEDNLTLDGETFKGWNKVLNGDVGSIYPSLEREIITGLQISYVAASSSGTSRNGNKYTTDQKVRSTVVESYYLKFDFYDDQGGNAFIVHRGEVEYKGSDSFTFEIPYCIEKILYRTDPPYVRLLYSFSIGDKYLQADGTWSTDQNIIEEIIDSYNSDNTITFEGIFDESVTENTKETYVFKIYDMDPLRYDLNVETDEDDYDLTDLDAGAKLVIRKKKLFDDYYINQYWELQENTTSKSWVEQSDIKIEADYSRPRTPQMILYLGEVYFMTFPDGVELEEEQTITFSSSKYNVQDLDIDLYHFDIDISINNIENMVVNYLRLEDGTPTQAWGANGKQIQQLVGAQMAIWYAKAGYRIKGVFRTDKIITPYMIFREPEDSSRVFMPAYMSVDLRSAHVEVEMVEVGSNDQTSGSAFTNGFKQNAVT